MGVTAAAVIAILASGGGQAGCTRYDNTATVPAVPAEARVVPVTLA